MEQEASEELISMECIHGVQARERTKSEDTSMERHVKG
jgi:hypothetical protein